MLISSLFCSASTLQDERVLHCHWSTVRGENNNRCPTVSRQSGEFSLVCREDSVESLRQKLATKLGNSIKPRHIKMFRHGVELHDGNTLQDYSQQCQAATAMLISRVHADVFKEEQLTASLAAANLKIRTDGGREKMIVFEDRLR